MDDFIMKLGWFAFYLGLYAVLIAGCCVADGFMERGKELKGK